MLKSIENSFIESEIKVKLQLVVLPLFCIYFYMYLFDNKKIIVSSNINSKLNTLLSKKFSGSYLNLIKEIESFCLQRKIKITSIDYNKNNLLIKGKTSLVKINDLIIKIENINNFSNLKSLTIEKTTKTNSYLFEIRTEFKKFYLKTKLKKIRKQKTKDINTFKLKAIISNYVLLNNKWYSLNDFIGKYKIIKIEKNLVILNSKDKTINIKLKKNE